eukprot:1435-Pelagococcus_subviridis.AAC.2
MLSDSVAQNPTTAVTEGKNTDQNCPARAPPAANALGADSITPSPPAAPYAHINSAAVSAINTGAANRSSVRMLSIPRHTMTTCAVQNKK